MTERIVTVIPATKAPIHMIAGSSAKKNAGLPDMQGYPRKKTSSTLHTKRRWITTHSSSRAMPDGSLLRSTRTRESVALEQENVTASTK